MVYVIQSDADVPPGLVADALEVLAVDWRLVRLDRGEPLSSEAEPDALIVLGGTMSVHDEVAVPFLKGLKRYIRECLERGIPFLGICLGGQLLSATLGAAVVRDRWGELGSCMVSLTEAGRSDRLFRGLPPGLKTFQWHRDSFDLPAGAVLLASTATCPHQAFRVGDNAWGLQFHPEVTADIIASWAAAESLPHRETQSLIADWARNGEEQAETMFRMMRNLLHG
jgi:GMP synthase-like glutamine amidotransferase